MSARALLLLWLGTLLLFAAAPGIDLAVSGLFHDAGTGRFPAADSTVLSILRETIWTAANLCAVLALVFGTYSLLSTRPTEIPGRVWGFALLLILLGPLLLVNGVFKAYWGRARPADVDVFGGTQAFTPPWQIAQGCADNCSFTSGEAAAVTCLAILLGLFLRRHVNDRRRLFLALAALVVIGAGMRVAKGRHFLSDVAWSVIFMLTLASILAHWLRLKEVLERITLTALWSDARAMGRALKAAATGWRR